MFKSAYFRYHNDYWKIESVGHYYCNITRVINNHKGTMPTKELKENLEKEIYQLVTKTEVLLYV